MKCEQVQSLLSQYLDNELDELRRKKIDRHLQTCVSCSRELTSLAKTVRVLHAVSDLNPPRDYY